MSSALTEIIETTYQIRRELKSYIEFYKCLDVLRKHRDATKSYRKKLIKRYGKHCAICGDKQNIETAHIVPLEIGGPTECENLVLLCHTCHSNFDGGAVSINEMKCYARKWRSRNGLAIGKKKIEAPARTEPSMFPPPATIESKVASANEDAHHGHFPKAIKELKKICSYSDVGHCEKMYIKLKIIELTRRRNKQGVLKESLDMLSHIDPIQMPAGYLAWLYYENGYVRRMLGDHLGARDCFCLQYKNASNPVEVVSARNSIILCDLASVNCLDEDQQNDFDSKLGLLQQQAAQHGDYWGGRWSINCAAHRVHVQLKAKNTELARTRLEDAINLFFSSDRGSGWTLGARRTFSLLEGMSLVLNPSDDAHLDDGIRLLARAFVNRCNPRRRPEGVRDVMYGLELSLRKRGYREALEAANALKHTLKRVRDGTSVLDPWRCEG